MHNLPVEVDEGLSEMDVGEVDGLSLEKVRELYPDFLQRWLGPEVATLPMPGGESLQEVQDRAWEAVQRIAGRHPEDIVCAVSHNFTIHVILCRALGLPITEFRRLRHDLAAVSVLDISGDRAVLVRLNDTCHLEGAGPRRALGRIDSRMLVKLSSMCYIYFGLIGGVRVVSRRSG